jgi:hypothetical protein
MYGISHLHGISRLHEISLLRILYPFTCANHMFKGCGLKANKPFTNTLPITCANYMFKGCILREREREREFDNILRAHKRNKQVAWIRPF